MGGSRRCAGAALVLIVIGVVLGGWGTAGRPAVSHKRVVATVRTPPLTVDRRRPRQVAPREPLTVRALREVRVLAARGLPLFCGGAERRMVALTFDDGPGVYTHYAVHDLAAAHARATFFLVGRSVVGWPGWAGRERRYAAFGDHTMTHPFLPGLSPAAAAAQILTARRLIARAVHEPVVLFRPPYGAHTPAIDAVVRRLGMLQVLWDVDSRDSLGADYVGIEHNVISGLRPGSIVLMHENRGQTIRALPVIFAALRRRHLEAVSLLELLAEDPPSLARLRRGYAGCPVRAGAGAGS